MRSCWLRFRRHLWGAWHGVYTGDGHAYQYRCCEVCGTEQRKALWR